MKIQISKKEGQLLLIGFLLGVITVLAAIKILDTSREVQYVPVSLDELEQSPEGSSPILEMSTDSVDQADLESF
jgi:hypothetical protein